MAITDQVCAKVLDEEYTELARQAVAKLARKRPSPLLTGRPNSWAAAIIYALGQVNFLFDAKTAPHLTPDELSEIFGLAKSTMSNKAKQVRGLLNMSQFTAEFLRSDLIAGNPGIWLLEVNGLIMDIRTLPLEYQAEAYRKGLIPYIPALRELEP